MALTKGWTWEERCGLVLVPSCFLFQCLKKWGFRRCEDICWVKTNMGNPGNMAYLEPKSVFQHTKVGVAWSSLINVGVAGALSDGDQGNGEA